MPQVKISQFLDSEGRITQLPRRQNARLAILQYLSGKFQIGCEYSEQQINVICDQWHTFGDYFLLRRELVDHRLLNRERDGSRYWRSADAENPAEAEMPIEETADGAAKDPV